MKIFSFLNKSILNFFFFNTCWYYYSFNPKKLFILGQNLANPFDMYFLEFCNNFIKIILIYINGIINYGILKFLVKKIICKLTCKLLSLICTNFKYIM